MKIRPTFAPQIFTQNQKNHAQKPNFMYNNTFVLGKKQKFKAKRIKLKRL